MPYENIRLRRGNFSVVGGYYWMMDEGADSIIVKTDDGTLAYSYPLDTTITETVKSLEYDGHNIWTMRATDTDQLTIDRWYIKNYICTLRNSFDFVPSGAHVFNSDAFTVEHYHTTFGDNEAVGQSVLSVIDAEKLESGYTVVLGPNSSGQIEEKTVSSATSGSIQINGTTLYAYNAGDPVSFYSRIWLFNNADGIDDSTGALYEIDAYTGSVVTKYPGGAYKDIQASTFFGVPKYVFDKTAPTSQITPRFNSVAYVKGTNLLFLDPDDLSTSFGSMTLDNIEDDQATNIDVYDISIEGTNIYRLQLKATYYGTTGTFANQTYDYQLSTLNSFITSISLRADPAILPANGVNVSTIQAVVKDQFNLPVIARQVAFTDDDEIGSILTSPVNTNGEGVAETTYKSGVSAREVRITATARQT